MAAHANTPTNSAPQATAGGAYFSHSYRKYCSLLTSIPNLPADASDDAVAEAQEAANELRDNILSARAGTLENLAVKLRVLAQDEKDALHASGGDAETFGRFTMLAADLDCIMSAEPASHPDFVAKLAAYVGYDAVVKALPKSISDAEIEQADGNRFDALADLMEAKPQTASEAAAQLRIIVAQQPDFLSGDTPIEQTIRAGLANVLAAIERLAAERR